MEKKKRGRPAGQILTQVLRIRVKPSERDRYVAIADYLGITLSEFARRQMDKWDAWKEFQPRAK